MNTILLCVIAIAVVDRAICARRKTYVRYGGWFNGSAVRFTKWWPLDWPGMIRARLEGKRNGHIR